ncbi:MAG: dipeptidase [Candidatus Marinimicrobia bacterium]|nr:dipeptidase [Candidatus Neomarinimicrobiota bacterium]
MKKLQKSWPIDLRSILPIFALFVLGSCGQESERDLVATARAIHDRVITIDTHNDINPSNFSAERNYTMDLNTQVNIPKMESGGLDVSWMIVYVGQGPLNPDGYANAYDTAIAKFEAIHRLAEEIAPEQIEIAYTSEDVRRIAASGKKVAMIGIENAYPIGLDLSNIRKFQERGGRYMSLAHNGHNQLSDSNTGERDNIWMHNGLSDLGKQAIAEMNQWGIMVDISHPSKEAIMQMIELSKAPVMASHSSARSLNDVSRNLDDEQLRAVQANGGVVQTVAFSSYVDSDKNTRNREALTALQQEVASELGIELLDRSAMRSMSAEERSSYATKMEAVNELTAPRISEEVNSDAPPVDVADFVNHIDYLVDLIGIDHVGISSDFDGGGGVEGWNDASETFAVTLELVQRGYTEADIAKLWGENLLRVLDEVQRIASEIQSS